MKEKFEEYWKFVEPHWGLLTSIFTKLKERSKINKILPNSKDTFRVFKETPLKQLKVVIIGYDPYNSIIQGNVAADGLAFSNRDVPIQPSLRKIFDAMNKDYGEFVELKELSYLASQGVLLLNSALTIEENQKAGCHTELWKPFMLKLLEELSHQGLIFWFMGKKAEELKVAINEKTNHVFCTEHPAAAARNNRDWDHKDTFNKINNLLHSNMGVEFTVDWTFSNTLPF